MKSSLRLKTLVVALGVAACAAASAATATAPAMARATRLGQGDVVSGALALSQPMHIVIGLKLQNKAELDAYIAKRGFKPLTGAQFVARYSPSVAQAQAVANYLKQQGFTDVKISSNRILVSGNAPAANVQRAFGVSLVSVKTHDGRVAYANTNNATVPASMQSYINGVVGLQTVHIPHLMYKLGDPNAIDLGKTHSPTDFSSIYGASSLPVASNIDVGILAEGDLSSTITSLNNFTSANGLPTVSTRQVGTPNSDTSGDVEWKLDSQTIVGAAGGQVKSLVFYLIADYIHDSSLAEGINLVVTDNTVKLINGSIANSEVDAKNDGVFAATDPILEQAVAQGQTFSFATGDYGAGACDPQHATIDGACWPAASAYVVATGGTTLDASTGSGATWNNETVWNGAGGSQSAVEAKPAWQTAWNGPNRAIPDIAFDANPSTGAKIYSGNRTESVGGTSLASPIFVGLWSRVMAGKGNLGFAAPLLYPLSASDFHDITSGSNGNPAGPGYDLASGRGSLIMSGVYNDVGGGNQPPVASFTYKTKSLYVQVTSTSTDPDGTIASVKWDSGDGRTSTKTPLTYKYAKPGTYTVTLTVTDNDGATDSTSQQVTVQRGG